MTEAGKMAISSERKTIQNNNISRGTKPKKSADLQEVQRVHGLPWHQCFQQDPERTHHYVSELGRTTGNVAIETSDVHYKLKDFHILMGYNGV